MKLKRTESHFITSFLNVTLYRYPMQEATVSIVDYTSEEEVNIPMVFPSGFSANVSECMHLCDRI